MKFSIFFSHFLADFFCYFLLAFFTKSYKKRNSLRKCTKNIFDAFSGQSVCTFCGSTNTLSIPNFCFVTSFDFRFPKTTWKRLKTRKNSVFSFDFHHIYVKYHENWRKKRCFFAFLVVFMLFSETENQKM